MGEQDKNIIIYQSDDGKAHLQVRLENQTMWLSVRPIADLFDCSTDNISLH